MVDSPSLSTASAARIEANRRNALRSTGPRTAEGKDRSRRNAVKHGLSALVVAPEICEANRNARAVALADRYAPADEWGRWLVEQAAATSVQIDEADRAERSARLVASARADCPETWAADRAIEAEQVAGRLRSRPAEVVRRLMRTPAGCDWLIDRWTAMLVDAESAGGWSPESRALAHDLLGTPIDRRDESPRWPGPGDDLADPASIALAMIGRIERARADAAELDEIDRLATVAGVSDEASPTLRKLRRHHADLFRRLRRLIDGLEGDRVARDAFEAEAPTPPSAGPTPISAPIPTAPAEAASPRPPQSSPRETKPTPLPSIVGESITTRPGQVELPRKGRDVRAQSNPRGEERRRNARLRRA